MAASPSSGQALEKLLTMRMPFGKYEGWVLADLPANYLGWFAREGFPQGELGRLLSLMYEIDHNGLNYLLAEIKARQASDSRCTS